MIEDLLRESFARQEARAPGTDVLRRGIARLAARRRRRRTALLTGASASVVGTLLLTVVLLARQFAPAGVLPAVLPGSVPDRALNVLLLGLEPQRAGSQTAADSITIVHISQDRRHVYLVDIPRNLAVQLPGYPQPDARPWINDAHRLGGAALTATVVQNLTGLTLDGTVSVTPQALAQVTDTLGGVPVCLPHTITSIHTGRIFEAGCSTLDGPAVADLTRQRMGLARGGFDRSANIQRVLISLVGRAATLDVPADIGTAADLLAIDGITIDLPGIDSVELALQLRGLPAAGVVGLVAPVSHTTYVTGGGTATPPPDYLPGEAGGPSFESLDLAVAPVLFAALRDGTVADFVAAHPDWVVG